MGKLYGLCDLRIGKVGNLVFRKVENKNIISEKPKYYPVNSAWLTREEFKQYVLSLLDVGIPQIYALSELPEELYDYALIFVQTDEKCLVYLDKDGTRTLIRLEGGAADYDAVDIVDNLPQNPRNNTIYLKNDGDTRNDTPTYTMYVCENNTLTKIDLGSGTITASAPLEISDNDNISLNYNASHFILKNDQLSAEPIVNLIDEKQDKLRSGTNIRTVGGNSLVDAHLAMYDIGPQDIMNLSDPLKWDRNDPYKVKLGYNTDDFELDEDENLKIKAINAPVEGAVSPLYIDSNKKVNINYSPVDFSVVQDKLNAMPLREAVAQDIAASITSLSNECVKTAGNQTVGGQKTFTSPLTSTGAFVSRSNGNSQHYVVASAVTGTNYQNTGYKWTSNQWLCSINVTDKDSVLSHRLVFSANGTGATILSVMVRNRDGSEKWVTLAKGD